MQSYYYLSCGSEPPPAWWLFGYRRDRSQILFEVTSAISTVGLSLDFTSQLNTAGKIIISLTMFVGRVGLITLLSGLIPRQSSQSYTYAEENVIV